MATVEEKGLESVVLPLAESRALAEAGIVLDTALVWVYVKDANGKIVLTVMSRRDAAAACLGADCDGQKVICGAWTLSELLDAIRKRVDELITKSGRNLELSRTELDDAIYWEVIGLGKNDCEDDWQQAVGEGSTDLLAAAALLREVSK